MGSLSLGNSVWPREYSFYTLQRQVATGYFLPWKPQRSTFQILSVWPSECVDSVHILFVFRFYSLRYSLILAVRSLFNVLIWCIVFAPSLYASRCSNSLLSYTYSPLLRASRTLLISSWGPGVSETRPEWLFTSYPAREV